MLKVAHAGGIEVCFANPGTTEIGIVAALDRKPRIRSILGLCEGVCTGAADGYGRMLGKPAMTLLHLGPGFANGFANLHNAYRANSSIVNIVGDLASWHVQFDAPLASDIHSLAGPVSCWVCTVRDVNELPEKISHAIEMSRRPPGGVVTLVIPSDVQHATSSQSFSPCIQHTERQGPDYTAVRNVAERLRQKGRRPLLLLGGNTLTRRGQTIAAAIASHTGSGIYVETFPARIERGRNVPQIPRLPYFPEQAMKVLDRADVILAGTRAPVSYFGYEGIPGQLVDDDHVETLCTVAEDGEVALEMLADSLGVNYQSMYVDRKHRHSAGSRTDDLTARTAMEVVAAAIPAESIVVTEGAMCSTTFYEVAADAAPHTVITNTGGAIGQGPACAIGTAIACPDRQVINIESDGSAQYTIQSLWTQAREQLNIITLLCSNRRYGILQTELSRAGISHPGPQSRSLTMLDNPTLDWVSLAKGYGVLADRATDCETLRTHLTRALESQGPRLIEICFP